MRCARGTSGGSGVGLSDLLLTRDGCLTSGRGGSGWLVAQTLSKGSRRDDGRAGAGAIGFTPRLGTLDSPGRHRTGGGHLSRTLRVWPVLIRLHDRSGSIWLVACVRRRGRCRGDFVRVATPRRANAFEGHTDFCHHPKKTRRARTRFAAAGHQGGIYMANRVLGCGNWENARMTSKCRTNRVDRAKKGAITEVWRGTERRGGGRVRGAGRRGTCGSPGTPSLLLPTSPAGRAKNDLALVRTLIAQITGSAAAAEPVGRGTTNHCHRPNHFVMALDG